jgi:hypothetical protein
MPALVAGIHDFGIRKTTKVVDARHSPGMTVLYFPLACRKVYRLFFLTTGTGSHKPAHGSDVLFDTVNMDARQRP